MKVTEMSRNAYVLRNFETDSITLQSYNSEVVRIDNFCEYGKVIVLGKHWDYSITTLKHVYRFLGEYAPEIVLNPKKSKKNAIEEQIKNGNIYYNENLI